MADRGKEILEETKRLEKSEDIIIMFDDTMNLDSGVVLKEEAGFIEASNIKYFVKISMDSQEDSCTCQSFYHGNTKIWLDEHGECFQCKHIMKFKRARGWL
jgi:hypothetical protein